ncbi:BIR protein [Plasmodium berghei]|uniref:BIR protein n=1 Tax=Plasmodium berghei TaxID=5821 RepID=A0A0Y9XF55_PLABE|nr:BIR protein [Plasmodium berghei]
MNDFVCRRFIAVKNSIFDQLDNKGSYKFINENNLNGYCTSNRCDGDLEKINAGCLFLFDALFKNYSVFKKHNNINIVDYIIIWLSYMLNLKEQAGNMNNIQYFYTTYINNDKYKNTITDVTEYKNYKDLIDKTNMMNMDIKDISKFYDAFSTLCMMYIEFNEKSPNCKKYVEEAKKFVKKYEQLNGNSNITGNSSYNKILSTLSTDYNNFKNKCISNGINCTNFPSLPTIEPKQPHVQSSGDSYEKSSGDNYKQTSEYIYGQTSEVTSSSSPIGNKLFTVLSIFGAIAFFLGISYKYSLFGFRKRAQKQYLREKIKNIKRMNH